MPFMPGTMPSLGLSLLKAGLERDGIACDIFYGSTVLIDAMARRSSIDEALMDYQVIGSTGHLGDLMFSSLLWGDAALDDAIRDGLKGASGAIAPIDRAAFLARNDPATGTMAMALDACLAARRWSDYRIVGFSSTFAQSLASLWLARAIKSANPDVRIVFGGANVDGTMGAALLDSFEFVDDVLQGEADASFPSYVGEILSGNLAPAVSGIVTRTQGGRAQRMLPATPVTDLDALPIPDFADFFAQLPASWSRDRVMLPFETSRGCWWGAKSHCIFCGLNAEAMQYRSKTGDRAIGEVDALIDRWGVRRLWAVDNILPRDYFSTFLPQLPSRDVELFYETKSNLQQWQVAGLAAAGVTQIQPGVESLNTRLLGLMKKGVSRHRNIQLLRWCQTHLVDPLWFYLYGFPGDLAEDYHEDANIMARLVHLPPPRSINPVTVDRFSPLYTEQKLRGGMVLRQQSEHRQAFSGLDEEQSDALCYHFEAQAGTAAPATYYDALADGHLHWLQRYKEGAQLSVLAGAQVSLIYDHRSSDGPRLYLLAGLADRVHRAIDLGATAAAVAERCRGGVQDQAENDLQLIMVAIGEGAEFAPEDGVDAILAWMDSHALVARDGAVWQALAVPRLPLMTAVHLGLEQMVLEQVGRAVAPPAFKRVGEPC